MESWIKAATINRMVVSDIIRFLCVWGWARQEGAGDYYNVRVEGGLCWGRQKEYGCCYLLSAPAFLLLGEWVRERAREMGMGKRASGWKVWMRMKGRGEFTRIYGYVDFVVCICVGPCNLFFNFCFSFFPFFCCWFLSG